MKAHPGLEWLASSHDGRAWLQELPRLIEECAELWSLEIGEPFPYASASLAMPATLSDGSAGVLKVQYPHRESLHEAAALVVLDGDGAVFLLAHDSERSALLLERCLPGTPLSRIDADEALTVVVSLLPRLWKGAGAPFRSVAEEAAWWAGYLPGRWERLGKPFERSLLDAALSALEELPPSQGEQVLVNQDLHADNILRASREPWLVIDPKPLVGEREFGVTAIVRGHELGEGERALRHRLDRVSGDLGLDRDRVRRWVLGQTVAWATDEDEVFQVQIEVARSLLRLE